MKTAINSGIYKTVSHDDSYYLERDNDKVKNFKTFFDPFLNNSSKHAYFKSKDKVSHIDMPSKR